MKIRSIQVLRALAVSAVCLVHASQSWGENWALRGAAGVDLFFVISGFIIGRVSIDRDPLEFLKARLRRIFLPYYVAAIFYVVFAVRIGGLRIPEHLFTTLTLIPLWQGVYVDPVMGPAWSMGFELVFYIGMTLFLVSRRLVAACAMIGAAAAIAGPSDAGAFLFNPLLLEFAMGLLISRTGRRVAPLSLAIAGIALFVFAPIPPSWGGSPIPSTWSRSLAWGLPSAAILQLAVAHEAIFRWRAWTPIVKIGDASYSIYLTHIILTATSLSTGWLVAAMISVGLIFHRVVERPVLRLGGRGRGSETPDLPGERVRSYLGRTQRTRP